MLFDFDTFADIVESVFPAEDTVFTLHESLFVFREYFRQYEEKTGRAHPNISTRQIVNICAKMHDLEEGVTIYPEIYPFLIRRHFRTKYRNCDYNINHFFSGKIRQLRYFEVFANIAEAIGEIEQ